MMQVNITFPDEARQNGMMITPENIIRNIREAVLVLCRPAMLVIGINQSTVRIRMGILRRADSPEFNVIVGEEYKTPRVGSKYTNKLKCCSEILTKNSHFESVIGR